MLDPDRPHLFVGRELTTARGSLGAGDGLALFGRKHNGLGRIGTSKLHDGARDVILIG